MTIRALCWFFPGKCPGDLINLINHLFIDMGTIGRAGWIVGFLLFFDAVGLAQAPSPSRAAAQAPTLRFTHVSDQQGLSNSTIESIFQDSRGFIWAGTRDGLNRYDGNEMLVFRNDPVDSTSLTDNYIRCIYEDRSHQLWVGTINGLNRLNPEKNNFIRFKHRAGGENHSLSNNMVTSIAEDTEGRLWIGTFGGGLNRWDPASQSFIHFAAPAPINIIYPDRAGHLWVGGQSSLDLFHPKEGKWTHYQNTMATNASGNTITAIQADRQGNLWLGTEDDGIFLFDPLHHTFTRFAHSDKDPASLGNNMIKSLLVDKMGRLWVGSINGGLNLYHPQDNAFFHYEYQPGNNTSLSQRTVSALREDRQGNLWIGTHRGGINIYSPGMEKFNLYRQESAAGGLSYNDVRAFCEDNGDIWIGTDGGGLDLFQRDKNRFRSHRYDPFDPHSLGSDAVLDVMRDRQGNIYVATWGGGLNLLDKTTGHFTRYQNRPGDSSSISSNFVQKTFEDYEGRLWVATYYGGLNLFDPATGKFSRLASDPSGKTSLRGKNIVALHEDREGQIWIGTDDGGLNCYQQTTRHFTHYFDKDEKMPDLRVIFSDSRNRLWVGQRGLYLFDTAHNNFRLYTDRAGLSNEFIKGITEDEQGNLWISTSNGLTRFNPETYAYKKYNTGDGLQGEEFEANACLKTRDGEMYFGGVNGFNSFYAASIGTNPYVPPVYITGFQLFNQKMSPGLQGSPLQRDISLTQEIRLTYKQSTFSFNFAALNYTIPENNQYAYKMEGLDKDWNYVGKERRSVYTNLGPGEYTFRVRASNNDGVWNEAGASVRVIITPPFWLTPWFIGLLAVLGLGGLYAFYRHRSRLRLRELEERKREEIHQVQLQFFTNISHEFRTPLSLILGPLEKLMKENVLPSLSQHYASMHRNANRLLSLINELMDFGKLESGALKLGVMRSNLPAFLDEMEEEFRDWAHQKEIGFTVRYPATLPDTWFDRQVLEKIVLNLLHNSFKYTKIGGHITLEALSTLAEFRPSFANELVVRSAHRGSSYVYIRVADTGIGISAESIRHLFERYYRITDSHLGSGVGLAFVKSLALLHKGDVLVYSQRNKGTEIIIGIPVNAEDYTKEETATGGFPAVGVRLEGFAPPTAAVGVGGAGMGKDRSGDIAGPTGAGENGSGEVAGGADAGNAGSGGVAAGSGGPGARRAAAGSADAGLFSPESILLVEDNEELRLFIRESLEPYYSVTEAADGREGLALARDISPDLIISDVIMPGMNGIEFCKAVKQDIDTSHIPFLMLTARTTLASQVHGLDSGADYYFAKPLNMELLLLTIRNRFEQSARLKERYTRDSHIEAMELVHSGKDKEFMTRLLTVIDSQLVNPDFDIDWLCNEMGMSRTKLYQKIKNISQQSIGDFIRTIRLKKAVQIMTHEDVSLSEVMYRIGIQTQSYFSKAFKKEFGKTPTQFMQEIKKY